MDERKHVRHTQTLQPRVGQLHQRLCPVTHQGEHPGSQRLEPRLDQSVPGVIAPVLGDLFKQQGAAHQVHEHQHHPFQKRFIHRADNGPDLTLGDTLAFPCPDRLQDEGFELLHHGA
jgi:hypothetical protein